MKKLTRNEMKNVMGGSAPAGGGCQGTVFHGVVECENGIVGSLNQCANSSFVCSNAGLGPFIRCICLY